MAKTWAHKEREKHIKRSEKGKAMVCCVCGAQGGKYPVYLPSTNQTEMLSVTLYKIGGNYYCQDCKNPGGSE